MSQLPRRTALANLGGERRTSGEPELVRVLEDAMRSAASEPPDQGTHGFHAYPARMHPAVPRVLLRALATPRSTVLDPFCGSGTTLVEARCAGLRSTGVDLNPVALRIADTKTRVPSDADAAAFRQALSHVAEANLERVAARAPARAPLSPADARRYDPHVLRELAGLHAEVRAIPDEGIRRLLEVVFSSIVVKFARQRADTDDALVDKRIGRFVPTRFFRRKGEELLERWEEMRARCPPSSPAPKLTLADARTLDQVLPPRHRFDLVISSPPYGGTYDYFAHHRLRLAWLHMRAQPFAAGEIGARRRLAEGDDAAARWQDEVRAFLRALSPCLRRDAPQGAWVFLLMGDGMVGGRRVPADAQLRALAPEVGLSVRAVVSELRRDWQGGPPRHEHLIALHAEQAPTPR